MISREFAWRVFAREFNDATLEIPAGEERASWYGMEGTVLFMPLWKWFADFESSYRA